MPNDFADARLAGIAGAIAEPARARMLCCLMDGHARTSTELAVVGEIGPSTASVHLARLKEQQLVQVLAQGKHRYYSLAGAEVASALEALMRLAGMEQPRLAPSTPGRLRHARTCYDHMAGAVAVGMHDFMARNNWLGAVVEGESAYQLSDKGMAALTGLGLDPAQLRKTRRRFACACIDWSERRPHLGGALGAGMLALLLKKGWVERDLDSRALAITREGRRQFKRVFEIDA